MDIFYNSAMLLNNFLYCRYTVRN